MAVADPVPSANKKRAPRKTSHAAECQPFDVDLLCSKLEAAKLELDIERARRRHRDALRSRAQESPAAESHRRSMILPAGDTTSNVQRSGESKNITSSTRKNDPRSRPLFAAALSLEKTKFESTTDPYASSLGIEDPHQPKRNSTDALAAVRSKATDVPKRKPVPTARRPHFEESEDPAPESAQKTSPIDASKRRSKTFPFQVPKLAKPRPVSAYSYSETIKSRPQRDHSPESPMGLVNEYTMSFDLADMLRDEGKQRSAQAAEKRRDSSASPPLVPGLRSRSLLNLSSLLKKERAEIRTNEVDITPEDVQENPRSLTSANGHHMRQKSLPIHFHSDALMRCKREEREKKRKSFVGFFKIF